MNLSGTLEPTSSITLARLLERIFDTDRPGELVLTHAETGEKAVLTIKHGEVAAANFRDLGVEQAVRQLGQSFPWNYTFGATGQAQGDGSLGGPTVVSSPTPRAPVAARIARPAVKSPAIKREEPTLFDEPVVAQLQPAEPQPAPLAPPRPVLDLRSLHTPETLAPWVQNAPSGTLRFFDVDGVQHGDLSPEEWAYFQADYAFMAHLAATIGSALGFSKPNMVTLVEPQRAACYWKVNEGFAGAYSGADASVADFFDNF